jgi:hypothetical protein
VTAVAFAAGSQHAPAASAASVVPQHGDAAGADRTGTEPGLVLALEQQELVVESGLSVIVGLLVGIERVGRGLADERHVDGDDATLPRHPSKQHGLACSLI